MEKENVNYWHRKIIKIKLSYIILKFYKKVINLKFIYKGKIAKNN